MVMKCRKCEAIISPEMLRCPKCGALIPRTRSEKKDDSEKKQRFDVILISYGENREKVLELLSALKRESIKKTGKDFRELPAYVFQGISSDNALTIKNRFESIGASVKIQESRRKIILKGKDTFWKRNKFIIQISSVFFITSIILIFIVLAGLNERVPSVYKSKKDLSFSKKKSTTGRGGKMSPGGSGSNLVSYSLMSEDIIDSQSEAGVIVNMKIDESVSDEKAVEMLRKIGEEQKKRGGFRYFDHPQKVEVVFYKEDDKEKVGDEAWSHKYSWKEGELGRIISQNIKKINAYDYSTFTVRRLAYYLDGQFQKDSDISPEIKLFPSELKDMGVQIGLFDEKTAIDRKDYLAKVAENVGIAVKDIETNFEGVFIELPEGHYFITPELCKLAESKSRTEEGKREFSELLWRNVQKDNK